MYEGKRLRMPYLTTPPPPSSQPHNILRFSLPRHHHQHNPFTPSPSYASHVSLLAFILFAKHSLLSLTFSVASSSSSSSYPVFHSVVLLLPSDGRNNNTHFPLLFSHILLVSYFYQWVAWLLIEMVMSYLDWLSISRLISASAALIGTLSFWNRVLLPQTNQKVSHCIHLVSEPSHTGARKLNLATLRIKWRILTYHLISSIPLLSLPAKLHNSLYYLHPSTHNDLSHFLYSSSASLHSQYYPLLLCSDTTNWPPSCQTSSIKYS